mmetsp:Transcript_18379/g.27516  ORF Transcript_18379/g.27516 Transcript_18379/m.27516 type:complete len:166 (+) Transcript_18379:71-568(+)
MGGEYGLYVNKHTVHKLNEKKWKEGLKSVLIQYITRFSTKLSQCGSSYEIKDGYVSINLSEKDNEPAFSFKDTENKWHEGSNKSFSVSWKWDESKTIASKLGGRHRNNWHYVTIFSKLLCGTFPDHFGLLVCDGLSGYHDDFGSQIYDGKGWKEVDWKKFEDTYV